jgi:hypothetical protein
MAQKSEDPAPPKSSPASAKNVKVVVKVSDKSGDKDNNDEMVETGSQNAEGLESEGQAAVAASEQAEEAQHNLYSK